jgi:hypothetical protein
MARFGGSFCRNRVQIGAASLARVLTPVAGLSGSKQVMGVFLHNSDNFRMFFG